MKNIEIIHTIVPMPLLPLRVASPIIETNDHRRILISPGSRTTPEQFRSMGQITDLVAPSLFHCSGIANAAKYFPKARTWYVSGAEKKHPTVQWTDLLTPETWPFQSELEVIEVKGMPKVKESVFYHKESRNLIVADLCFNLVKERSLGANIILRLFGTYGKFAISRLFLNQVKDRNLFIQSMGEILSRDFETILPSHGDPVDKMAKSVLSAALTERGYSIK